MSLPFATDARERADTRKYVVTKLRIEGCDVGKLFDGLVATSAEPVRF